ncbi:MAG TPA: hypothetical protein VGB91_00290 [Rhizomicrobium sp.]
MPDKRVLLKGVSVTGVAGKIAIQSYGPLPDSHPFYGWVGQVASEWSHLEHILDGIIWSLAGMNPVRGACITSQIMGVGPRCKVIVSLGRLFHGTERILDEKTSKAFKTLMSDSYPVADYRARIVHDPWYFETIQNEPGQFKSMPYSDPRYGFVAVTKEEVERTLKGIRNLKTRATELGSLVHGRIEALRKTHPSEPF